MMRIKILFQWLTLLIGVAILSVALYKREYLVGAMGFVAVLAEYFYMRYYSSFYVMKKIGEHFAAKYIQANQRRAHLEHEIMLVYRINHDLKEYADTQAQVNKLHQEMYWKLEQDYKKLKLENDAYRDLLGYDK